MLMRRLKAVTRSPVPRSWMGARCNRRRRVVVGRYDGHKRRKGSKVHMAVDTLGHLLALLVTLRQRARTGQGGRIGCRGPESDR